MGQRLVSAMTVIEAHAVRRRGLPWSGFDAYLGFNSRRIAIAERSRTAPQ